MKLVSCEVHTPLGRFERIGALAHGAIVDLNSACAACFAESQDANAAHRQADALGPAKAKDVETSKIMGPWLVTAAGRQHRLRDRPPGEARRPRRVRDRGHRHARKPDRARVTANLRRRLTDFFISGANRR